MNKNPDSSEILPEPVLAACRAPIKSATTLPRQAFISPEFLSLERDRIFSRHWVAVLFEGEIPEAGDAKPFELIDIPLFAVRTAENTIHVFHNICPYDGCLVIIEPQRNLKEIETPYHGWRYDLTGKLQEIPYWSGKENTPLDSLNGRPGDLMPVRTKTWNGVVFINLSNKSETFASAVAPLDQILTDYRMEEIAIESRKDGRPVVERYTWNANWKTVLENTCLNVLHENFVHAAYRASPETPRVDEAGNPTFFNVHDGQLLGFGYSYEELGETYGSLPFPHLGKNPDRAPTTGYYLAFYPSLNISVWANAIQLEIVLPLKPGMTQHTDASFFEKNAASDPDFADARKEYSKMFEAFIVEDQRVVEAVQKGRQSPVYKQQYFSEFWDQNHYNLTQMILDDLVGVA